MSYRAIYTYRWDLAETRLGAAIAEFLAAVDALRESGVDEIAFYNYGHLRRANLQWTAAAMERLQ